MRQTTLMFLTMLFPTFACSDKGDDSAGAGDSDADTDADSDTDTDTDTDTDSDTDPGPIEIAGDWVEPKWGTTHTITDDTWTLTYVGSPPYLFHISSYDNDADYAIAQNDAKNKYSPSLWSRFDWAWDGADLYYCQTTYGAKSEKDAEATPAADSTDWKAGCAGFSWSALAAD